MSTPDATAPVVPAPPPWPLNEAHREMCARIAAMAITRALGETHAALDDEGDPSESDVRRILASEWLDIATRAEALSRPWGGR